MGLTSITAISAMVAPVVLITTGGMLTNGLLGMYGAVNDRMRKMTRERLRILAGPDGALLDPSGVPPIGQERLREITIQLPMMAKRHRLVRDAILLIYLGLAFLGLSVIGIAVAVSTSSELFGKVALGLVVGGTVIMLGGLALAARSLARSADAITYAIERTTHLS